MNRSLKEILHSAYAAPANGVGGKAEIAGHESINELIASTLTNFIIPVAAALAVGAVIYGGVLYIMSSGDPEKTAKAKRTILWAILGVLLIVFTYAIVSEVQEVMREDILK